jgi:hypothetical protein
MWRVPIRNAAAGPRDEAGVPPQDRADRQAGGGGSTPISAHSASGRIRETGKGTQTKTPSLEPTLPVTGLPSRGMDHPRGREVDTSGHETYPLRVFGIRLGTVRKAAVDSRASNLLRASS